MYPENNMIDTDLDIGVADIRRAFRYMELAQADYNKRHHKAASRKMVTGWKVLAELEPKYFVQFMNGNVFYPGRNITYKRLRQLGFVYAAAYGCWIKQHSFLF